MKKIFFVLLAYFSAGQAFAADAKTAFGTERVTENLRLGGDDLVGTIDSILGYVIGLFYFIAIIFAVYAGFLILTSGGEEERVKKGKKMFLYVLAGLILVLLASQIIDLVIEVISNSGNNPRPDVVAPTPER